MSCCLPLSKFSMLIWCLFCKMHMIVIPVPTWFNFAGWSLNYNWVFKRSSTCHCPWFQCLPQEPSHSGKCLLTKRFYLCIVRYLNKLLAHWHYAFFLGFAPFVRCAIFINAVMKYNQFMTLKNTNSNSLEKK